MTHGFWHVRVGDGDLCMGFNVSVVCFSLRTPHASHSDEPPFQEGSHILREWCDFVGAFCGYVIT
jgi:hypothetical protein